MKIALSHPVLSADHHNVDVLGQEEGSDRLAEIGENQALLRVFVRVIVQIDAVQLTLDDIQPKKRVFGGVVGDALQEPTSVEGKYIRLGGDWEVQHVTEIE